MKKNDLSWLNYGTGLTDALGELQSFEEMHAAEFMALAAERDRLLEKSAALGEKLLGLESDMAALKVGTFADMQSQVKKIGDLAKAADKLQPKAFSTAKALHERGLEILKLKIEKTQADIEAATSAQKPALARYMMATRFFDALCAGAGLSFPGIGRGAPCFDHATELNRQLKDFIEKLNVMEGRFLENKNENQAQRARRRAAGGFAALGHSTSDIHDILSFASQLPERGLSALVRAWGEALEADAAHVGMRFDRGGLSWKFTTRKSAESRIVYQTHNAAPDALGRAEV
jgi:hypothetical protein